MTCTAEASGERLRLRRPRPVAEAAAATAVVMQLAAAYQGPTKEPIAPKPAWSIRLSRTHAAHPMTLYQR